jgi:hypothetical protein
MTGHLFSDMPGSVAHRNVEIQMQLATGDVRRLLSVPIANGTITLSTK